MAGTAIGTRIRGVAIMATLLIVATGLYVAQRADGHTVTLMGIWTPSPRLPDGVQVVVIVGRSNKVDRTFTRAPFHESYSAQSGDVARIQIRTKGEGVSALVGCSVVIDGLEEMNNNLKNVPPGGVVECWGTVP
jgi:hypothetical protein